MHSFLKKSWNSNTYIHTVLKNNLDKFKYYIILMENRILDFSKLYNIIYIAIIFSTSCLRHNFDLYSH